MKDNWFNFYVSKRRDLIAQLELAMKCTRYELSEMLRDQVAALDQEHLQRTTIKQEDLND